MAERSWGLERYRKDMALNLEVAVPGEAYGYSAIRKDLDAREDMDENVWLADLVEHKVLLDLGCDIALRAVYLAPVAKQVVCNDPEPLRRNVAKVTVHLNRATNVSVVEEVNEDHLTAADVLLVDLSRMGRDRLRGLNVSLAPDLVILLGRLPKACARLLLDNGYEHEAEHHRGGVFRREAA